MKKLNAANGFMNNYDRTPKIALANNQYTGKETPFFGVKECVDKIQDILIKK